MPTITFRQPSKKDGYAIQQLIADCPPLDLNSTYTYLLLAEHFPATCILGQLPDGQIAGFVSAYLHPDKPDTLFVWQVAVHRVARGNGLGKRMIVQLLQRTPTMQVRFLETTVGPDNAASRSMFAAVAKEMHAQVSESALFEPHMFGPDGHDDERLIRIGPLTHSGAFGQANHNTTATEHS